MLYDVPAETGTLEPQVVVRVCPTFGSRERAWQGPRGLHLALAAAASPLLRHWVLCMCCS